MSYPRTGVLLAAAVAALAFASPASAEPVKAGPPLPDELAVLAVGGAVPTPAANRTDHVAVHRFATADGGYRGRLAFPADGDAPLTITAQSPTAPLRGGALKRSVDGRFLTFTSVKAASGLANQDTSRSTAVRIASDRTWTDTPFGSSFMNIGGLISVGSVTVDGSRYWTGTTHSQRPFATIASGDAELTQVSGPLTGTVASVDVVDGALYATTSLGVSRLAGLPGVADTTAMPLPVLSLRDALDSAFVDTDGVGGADTAYVTRGTRGLWKFALAGGTWQPRGQVSGSFAWVTARAVAGAVELYATSRDNRRVQKLVDTAEIGQPVASTGPTTLALAPARARYTGLAFTPDSGFPSDPAPYPATPPVISASATAVDTALEASPKASVDLDVFDPNTPASELTVTATSANTTVLPNDRIAVSGSGERRTVTFDPAATGASNVTITVNAGDEQASVTVSVRATGVAPHPSSHYYSGAVDLSAAIDVGGEYFLGISDEINTPHLYKKGVSGAPLASFGAGFPGGESDFEGVTRFGDTILWTASHGNNRSGSARPERRFLAFTKVTGSGDGVDLEYVGQYTRLWTQWKAWDAANGHGLGANKLKFDTATVPGLLPNAPNGFNVEGLTMAPGSSTTAWFGMRAPTITGDDGIERALILPVTNIDKLTSDAVDAEFGAPILLDLGGRSIRDIAKNAADQYLIEAGTGDTDDSLKNWALYTWDGHPDHAPVFVNELPTDESRIGAWEGIAEVPNPLVAGSRALLVADSGDTGLGGKSYGQYVTIGAPVGGPAAVTGVTATAKPGAIDVAWNTAAGADRYYVTIKTLAGAHASGSPLLTTGTSASLEGLTAGTEYVVDVRAQNVATRSASSAKASVTPTQGARTPTTTAIELDGTKVAGETQKLVATISAPGATGTVQFLNNGLVMEDNFGIRVFGVVDGKAVMDATERLPTGLANVQAKYTTANPENQLSSDSAVLPLFIDYKPRIPKVEIVSVTGDRLAGNRVAIKLKLSGYPPSELYPGRKLNVELGTRLNGSATRTRLTGDTTPENPSGATGYAEFNDAGEATYTTTTLAAGKHRISASVSNYNSGYTPVLSDELPVTIAPAGGPPAEAPAVKRPAVAVTVTGSRITTAQITLTARVLDGSLAGSVQFFHGSGTAIGAPVTVVDGVATYTSIVTGPQRAFFARFEPATERDTTASAVSLAVPVLRGTTQLPFAPPTPTTTALEIGGERTVGSPLTATVTVAAASTAPLAARDVNGYVELLDNGVVISMAPVFVGGAKLDFGVLTPGPHTLQARYVSSDALRSEGSASATQVVDVVAEAESPVGGTVPATLSLTLGAPASFGAFAPGVERTYEASTTATVLSTAGDAALNVSEPGRLTNGSLALPSPLEVSFSKSVWTQPVSNEAVMIAFKQRVSATDALRTGAYSKTLTFTLSTTTP